MTVTAPVRPDTLSTAEALTASNVTYRQADYWCRVGVFSTIPRFKPNPGSGTARRWSVGHVQALTVCGRIAEAFADEDAWPGRPLPTVVLAHAVACLVRNDFPTDGVLMVNAEDCRWSDDPYDILGILVEGVVAASVARRGTARTRGIGGGVTMRIRFARPNGGAGSITVDHACELIAGMAEGYLRIVPADAVWTARPADDHVPCLVRPHPVGDPVDR
jgi:hypothetical protein